LFGLDDDKVYDKIYTELRTQIEKIVLEAETKSEEALVSCQFMLKKIYENPNNYIYFNCDDYNNQTEETCELWRIIGVFEDNVKIIRDESIGGLAWDHDKNQGLNTNTYSNNWETSSLKQFLNGLYYNRGDIATHMYYSWDDGSISTSVDLKEKGIKPSTRNLISESVWYLGGTYALENIYPNDLYEIERTDVVGETIHVDNPFSITANVGLMYISDYGYGTNLTKCNEDILNYNNTDTCRTDNWIYNDKYQWLITPNSIFSNTAATARDAGNVWSNVLVYSSYEVRPTLYLDENIYVNNVGDGTIENPYQIYYR